MRRPVAVTASAIVAILGSTFALIFAAGAFVSLVLGTSAPQPPGATLSVIMAATTMAAASIIGLLTAVGLFRLRPWARTSVLIFAGLIAVGSIFILVLTMAMPMPADVSAPTQKTVRQMMGAMFGIPLAIAIWWLIQFNTRSTKEAFTSGIPGPASTRPLSISIIAWVTLIGGVTSLIPIFTRAPAFLFGAQFNGLAAGVIYAIFAAISIYIGKGLLELDEGARVVGIGWFSFSLVHLAVTALVPPVRERLFALQHAMIQNQPNPVPDLETGMNVIFGFGGMVTGLCLWFLIRERAAFGQITQK